MDLTQKDPQVTITSPFWTHYRDLILNKTLPYQWDVINDKVKVSIPPDPASGKPSASDYSHSMRNLRIAAGIEKGDFSGFPFQDTDVFKWLEAASYALQYSDDSTVSEKLGSHIDEVISVIDQAQDADGYIDTKIQLEMPDKRFKGLRWSHELYTMGHFIEAAVAHYRATGSKSALEIAQRAASCIDKWFGDGENQIHGPDGHPEIELALVRLFEVTGEERWLNLSAWFIRTRGTNPNFFDEQDDAGAPQFFSNEQPKSYFQMDGPALDLQSADGHAVRLVYLATAMAKVGHYLDDHKMMDAAERLWKNILAHRMYVTGNIGSTQIGESFTYDDDLPNDLDYGETCASVGMSFYAKALLENHPTGKIADTLELELFNGMLAGIQLDGMHYFYVNPLEADPKASRLNPGKRHILTRRQDWFDCACCPSNVARLIASLDQYLYTVSSDAKTIYAHQFIENRADFGEGLLIEQVQEGKGYPWSGRITFNIENPSLLERRVAIRIPAWAAGWGVVINGEEQAGMEVTDGFYYVELKTKSTVIALNLPMRTRFVRAAARVRDDIGKVSIVRGPLVYCLEETDNESPLWLDSLRTDAHIDDAFKADLLGGVMQIRVPGEKIVEHEDSPYTNNLYVEVNGDRETEQTVLTFIPYYAWCNREEGQMTVWVNEA